MTLAIIVVACVTSLIGAVTAYWSGSVLLTRGLAFGVVAIAGSAVGAKAFGLVPATALLTAFTVLLVLVAGYTAWRAVPGLS